jgi:hypothetical protein
MKQRTAAMLLVLLAGTTSCHHASALDQLRSTMAPFTSTRDRAVRLVSATKPSLGAEDLNSLAVAYTALEEKGNRYAGFLVEVAQDASFTDQKNTAYASSLGTAIVTFNKSFAAIAPANERGVFLDDSWTTEFAASLNRYWAQHGSAIQNLSPQDKADLVKQLKALTIWPNYEDIATQPVSSPSPH